MNTTILPTISVPEMFEISSALTVTLAEPNECVYFGDTNTDMQTGNSAGMNTVGVTWGFRERKELEENHAKYIIDLPQELVALSENK